MSSVGATNSGLPVGYDRLLDMALHDALGRGQSVSVTATAGSSTLAVNGSGAYLFDTRSVASGPSAATFSASPNRVKDTITLSAAAEHSLSNDQIALTLMNATRPAASNGKTSDPDRLAATIQATVQMASAQAPTQTGYNSDAPGAALLAVQTGLGQTQTGDNSDAAETALLAQVAAYQSSPAAVANFRSLLAQGEQASPADRFYATYADPNGFQALTFGMSDTQKASFTTAFNNQTLTIGGEADLGGMMTGSTTDTVTVQGEAWSGTGGSFAAPSDNPNTIIVGDGLFGQTRVSWNDSSNVGLGVR